MKVQSKSTDLVLDWAFCTNVSADNRWIRHIGGCTELHLLHVIVLQFHRLIISTLEAPCGHHSSICSHLLFYGFDQPLTALWFFLTSSAGVPTETRPTWTNLCGWICKNAARPYKARRGHFKCTRLVEEETAGLDGAGERWRPAAGLTAGVPGSADRLVSW